MKETAARVGCSLGMLAILVAVLSGCGFGPGEDTGRAALLVTRDYGRELIVEDPSTAVNESSTALGLLDRATDLETAYGGGFVQSVNGLSGTIREGRSSDWFYSVNGVVAERGSADYPLADGDTVWWDYRDWTDAMQVGAVVGVYPAPFTTGYDGTRWSAGIVCLTDRGTCTEASDRLRSDGADLEVTAGGGTSNAGLPESAIRVLVGPWSEIADRAEGRQLAAGPARSGVFARFEEDRLIGLDRNARPAVDLGPDAGLVAAIRRGQSPPVWILTGGSDAGVERAVGILDRGDLARRYAAVGVVDKVGSLPWTEGGG